MHRWKVASALWKLNSCTRLATKSGMPPGMTCSPTSKDNTIVYGFILPSATSRENRQSDKPLNPVSTKAGEGQCSRFWSFKQRIISPTKAGFLITDRPKAMRRANNAKSKIRLRIEHIFAEQKERRDRFVRTIGPAGATMKIGLANHVDNNKCLLFLRGIAVA